MNDDEFRPWRRQLRRWLGLPLLLGWTVVLLLGAIPDEILPEALEGPVLAVRAAFDKVGVRSGSFVFSGRRGDGKRRYWAMRALVQHPSGPREVMHESPEGLRYPDVRWTVSVQDTISFKMFYLERISRLYEAVSEQKREAALSELRSAVQTRSVARFFCHSPLYAAFDPRQQVYLEVYHATVSYQTGEIRGHRETVMDYDCEHDRALKDWPEPSGQPDFPGVVWE